MKPGFLKKLVVLGKNNSISEDDSVEFSAIKLVDLKMENKQDFHLDLKRLRFSNCRSSMFAEGELLDKRIAKK